MALEDEVKKSGREPVTLVDLGLDRCIHRYGVSPCTAAIGVTGTTFCYNTRMTCQDPDNYSPAEHIIRFCTPHSPQMRGAGPMVPSVRSVSLTPAKIDITGGLGQRAAVGISLRDHPYHDRLLDPYHRERNGFGTTEELQAEPGEALQAEPGEALQAQEAQAPASTNIAGTFWGRMIARNPYYTARRCIVHTGYIVDGLYDPDNFHTREYLLESIMGPDASDTISIKAKDPLKMADDERAQAPRPSTGRLDLAIDESVTSATLVPAGVGDAEYPASGFIAIGDEIMEFTRVGDALTIERAQFGTDASTHDTDDTVQLCLRYAGQNIPFILNDLITGYTMTPLAYVPLAEWEAEAALYLPRTYSTLIPKPTPVKDLIKELSVSGLFSIWYAEREKLIKIRALRVPDEDSPILNSQQHLIADSVSVTDKPELRMSQSWVYIAPVDFTQSMSSWENFRQLCLAADLELEGPNKFGVPAINTIYSRWITSRNNGDELATRKVELFGEMPRQITFQLDAKDANVWTGDILRMYVRQVQDFYGNPQLIGVQIIEADEEEAGHRFKYTAQAYNFTAPLPVGDVISISVDEYDVNLYIKYMDVRGVPPTPATSVLFVVEAGVIVGQDLAVAAMRTGTWPVGATIMLENNGRIQGKGGRGASYISLDVVESGEDGGTALLAENLITIDNAAEIWGGGGGGGGEGNSPGFYLEMNPGGGGAGSIPGQGGQRAVKSGGGDWTGTGEFSDDGTSTAGGAATLAGEEAEGGAGGGPGLDGEDPANGLGGDDYAPGAAGNAVEGNSFITWSTTGDRRGGIV